MADEYCCEDCGKPYASRSACSNSTDGTVQCHQPEYKFTMQELLTLRKHLEDTHTCFGV